MKNIKFIVFYTLGGAAIFAGVALFVINIFNLVTSIDSQSTRFAVPGRCEARLEKDAKYVIYYEDQTTFDGKMYSTSNADVSGLRITVMNEDTSQPIDIHSPVISSTYDINGRSGRSIFELKADKQMNMIIEAEYTQNEGPEVILNIAPDITSKMLGGMGSAMGFLLIGFTGLIVIAVTIIMQIRTKKKYQKEIYAPGNSIN
jgi:hypothetical protein